MDVGAILARINYVYIYRSSFTSPARSSAHENRKIGSIHYSIGASSGLLLIDYERKAEKYMRNLAS